MNNRIVRIIIVAIMCVLLTSGFATHLVFQKNIIQDELCATKDNLSKTTDELNTTKNELASTQNELLDTKNELSKTNEELDVANTTIQDLIGTEYNLVYIGNYKITHYCCEMYEHICGTGDGLTATGTHVTAGRTVAVDPSVIPYGTTMYIEGYGFRVAEDCGGGVNGKHIDMAVDTHANALAMGTVNRGVWILVKK